MEKVIADFMALLVRITILPQVVKGYYYLQLVTNRTKEFVLSTGRCGNKGSCNHQNERERMIQR